MHCHFKTLFIPLVSILILTISTNYANTTGYTLFGPNGGRSTYLVDSKGNIIHTWTHTRAGGYSVYLLENGHLLRTAQATNAVFSGGGSQGYVQEIDWNGNVVWEYLCSSSTYYAHHDICPMPDNTVLIIAWELKTAAEATAAGRKTSAVMWPDKIIEVNRTTSQIVWEWHSWDHLIQNYSSSKSNYGVVSQHPELLNVNLGSSSGGPGGPGGGGGDWLHMNGLSYNATLNQIAFTSHMMSEVYVIDHSTTTAEAASHKGGKYGKGGDLLYRWGNPSNYGVSGTATFSVCHCPSWVPAGYANANNLLIFNNGTNARYSSIVEITPPLQADGSYSYTSGNSYAPASATWTYSNGTAFYAQDTGSCQRLANGNTLITSPDTGTLFEVNSSKQTVWSYKYGGGIARCQGYSSSYAGLANLTTPVELAAFSAEQDEEGVRLLWSANSESDNYGFWIQRRFTDSESTVWSDIAFIRGNGTSTISNQYEYLDEDLTLGARYYRLRQIDLDGIETLSDVVNVQVAAPSSFALEQNYPNPFNPATVIRYQLPISTDVILRVINLAGETVSVLVDEKNCSAGEHSVRFDGSQLASGIYCYQLITNGFLQTKKMTLLH